MNRRDFLGAAAALVAGRAARTAAEEWRTFEVTTRAELAPVSRLARVWLPLAHARGSTYQRVVRQSWKGSAPILRAVRDERTGAGILFAEWPGADSSPQVELTLTVATRDRAVDWRDLAVRGEPANALAPFLAPPRGAGSLLRDTARRLARQERDEVSKARAIYEWMIDHVPCDPAAADAPEMAALFAAAGVRAGCADLNRLFVALVRAAGVPARVVYGLRVAASRLLDGVGRSGDVTDAQHGRAEFHAARHGWIPVDPAALIASSTRSGSALRYARRQLFGAWEMNWIAFNEAQDLALPQSPDPVVPYFMYPRAEVDGRRADGRTGGELRYRITARDLE